MLRRTLSAQGSDDRRSYGGRRVDDYKTSRRCSLLQSMANFVEIGDVLVLTDEGYQREVCGPQHISVPLRIGDARTGAWYKYPDALMTGHMKSATISRQVLSQQIRETAYC